MEGREMRINVLDQLGPQLFYRGQTGVSALTNYFPKVGH
jgi:hypothetical protein